MAINKVVNKSTKTHGAMRNVISYVLRDDKVREGYVDITGPYEPEKIDWDNVYQAFLREKQLWGKDSGRMYAHNIISFHKDEIVTPEVCTSIGRVFADRFFPEHQSLIGVHQDKDHLHIHIITNSVSFIDGRKLHQTKRDLERQKDFTNKLCRELGLSVTERGKHFDGSVMDEGEITAWNKDKYNLLRNEAKNSFIADCAISIMESVPESENRDGFIRAMAERGWTVNWQETRKHIVFVNAEGQKVRDSNISKTFNMDIGKEALLSEFKRQAALREDRLRADQETRELDRYYADIQGAGSVIAGTRDNSGTDSNRIIPQRGIRSGESQEHTGGERNIDPLLTELDASIESAGDAIDYGEAQSGAILRAELESQALHRERRLKKQKRLADLAKARAAAERERDSQDLEL